MKTWSLPGEGGVNRGWHDVDNVTLDAQRDHP
jgi:hypothetical protein